MLCECKCTHNFNGCVTVRVLDSCHTYLQKIIMHTRQAVQNVFVSLVRYVIFCLCCVAVVCNRWKLVFPDQKRYQRTIYLTLIFAWMFNQAMICRLYEIRYFKCLFTRVLLIFRCFWELSFWYYSIKLFISRLYDRWLAEYTSKPYWLWRLY